MTVPAITISSNASKESVTSVVLRVILFGTIPTRILIIPDMPTDLPTLPELPVISPFLCLDDSESETRRAALSLETSSFDTLSGFSSNLTPTSSSSVGPFRKRSQSSATSIPSAVHTVGVLSPTRAVR
nr:hypothetical protein [Tanacetum cinerariifolium]